MRALPVISRSACWLRSTLVWLQAEKRSRRWRQRCSLFDRMPGRWWTCGSISNRSRRLALRRLWRSYEPLLDRFVTQVLRPFELKPLINSALTI